MKSKITKIVLISFAIFYFFNTAYAALNIETSVDVPANCAVTDTDGIIHSYGETSSPESYLAICALDAATRNGSISNTQLSNKFPSLGLFVAAINNIVADPNNQYWAMYQNGNFANSGITLLPIVAGDTILFQLRDFSDNNLGDQVTLHINSLIPPTPTIPKGSLGLTTLPTPPTSTTPDINTPDTNIPTPADISKPTFDISRAISFLLSEQKSDGSFGEDLYTDWAAVALAEGNNQEQVIKLIKYLDNTKIENALLTNYERHAMALMTLGLNPYDTNGENYIEKITSSFDGKQFGEINEDNDDIFALIVLQNAGYTINDKMISDDVSFVLNMQKNDGSWDESVDMTGCAIEALSAFNQNDQVKSALEKAGEFLKQNQKDNGGWNDNASSTAWALEGILAMNEKPENWKIFTNGETDGKNAFDYLATLQNTDGGIKDENLNNRIWETAYVVSALSGKTWNQTMQSFEKPKGTGTVLGASIKIAPKKVAVKPKIKNMATVINTVNLPSKSTQTEPTKRNWLMKILGNIFGL